LLCAHRHSPSAGNRTIFEADWLPSSEAVIVDRGVLPNIQLIPIFRRDLAAPRTLPPPIIQSLEEKEDHAMRRTMIALAATTGLLGFGTLGASALTPGPINNSDRVSTTGGSAIQKADYCGERCQHWHHRRWVESHHWREYHHTYNRYGYNGGYGPYYR
jgi:hypothetical protein